MFSDHPSSDSRAEYHSLTSCLCLCPTVLSIRHGGSSHSLHFLTFLGGGCQKSLTNERTPILPPAPVTRRGIQRRFFTLYPVVPFAQYRFPSHCTPLCKVNPLNLDCIPGLEAAPNFLGRPTSPILGCADKMSPSVFCCPHCTVQSQSFTLCWTPESLDVGFVGLFS